MKIIRDINMNVNLISNLGNRLVGRLGAQKNNKQKRLYI